MRPFIYSFFIWLTIISSIANAADRFDDRERNFVAGLRSRQLFSIAESYCVEALKRADISVTDQAALTVELMQSRASKALVASPSQRAAAWESVWQTKREFETNFPQHPKSLLVRIQTALSRLAYAASIQQELSAEMTPPADIDSARETMIDQLRQSRRSFEKIEREIQQLIPQRRAKSTNADEFSADQLTAMQNNVRYQVAKCNLQTAYGYDADDKTNRASIISDVLQQLSEVQNSASPQQRIWWLAKITQIECQRLIGRNVDALRILNGLPNEEEPLDLASQILEQRLLLAVARSDTAWAKKHLQQSSQTRLSNQSPQMDIAQLRAAVMLSKNADSDSDRQRWLDRAAEIVGTIETNHGSYWSRRAGLALIDATGSSAQAAAIGPSAGQREILLQTAKRATRNGNDEDALKAWKRAIELTPGGADRQSLQINASKILEGLKRHREASEILLSGSTENPQTKVAAAMHLRGCWNVAQLNAGDELMASLNQHLKQWPDDSTATQAAIWLAAELNQRRKFDSAIDALTNRQLTVSNKTIAQLRNTFYSAQKQYSGDEDRIKKLATKIVQYLRQQSAAINEKNIAESLVATSAEIALLSACLAPADVATMIDQHAQRFPIDPQSPIQLYNSVLKVLIDNDLPTAKNILETLTPSESDCRKLVSIVNRQMKNVLPPDPQRTQLANKFLLAVADEALRRPLSIHQTTAWNFQKAKLLRATDQYKRSLALLTPLAQQFRNDAEIQLEYARALTQSDDRLDDALKVWRRLAQQLKPRTENWYEAKFNVAQLLTQSGQGEEAEKILRYVEAVHGLEGSLWAKPIEKLLRKL